MATSRVFRSVLVTAGVLLIAACASQPATPLLERKFQQAAWQSPVLRIQTTQPCPQAYSAKY